MLQCLCLCGDGGGGILCQKAGQKQMSVCLGDGGGGQTQKGRAERQGSRGPGSV